MPLTGVSRPNTCSTQTYRDKHDFASLNPPTQARRPEAPFISRRLSKELQVCTLHASGPTCYARCFVLDRGTLLLLCGRKLTLRSVLNVACRCGLLPRRRGTRVDTSGMPTSLLRPALQLLEPSAMRTLGPNQKKLRRTA